MQEIQKRFETQIVEYLVGTSHNLITGHEVSRSNLYGGNDERREKIGKKAKIHMIIH